MATKISEVIEALLEIQNIHGDLPVLALDENHYDKDEDTGFSDYEWQPAEVKIGKWYMAMVVRIGAIT
jgi:hypothetical protein